MLNHMVQLYPVNMSYSESQNTQIQSMDKVFKYEYLEKMTGIVETNQKLICELQCIDEQKLSSQDSFLQLMTNLKGKFMICRSHANLSSFTLAQDPKQADQQQ